MGGPPASVSLQPSPSLGEAEVLQPHGLEPGEGHVDLGAVHLFDRVGDARLRQRGGRVRAGLRVDLVAPGELVGSLRPRCPGSRPGPGDFFGRRLVADHHRAGAVGGRAGLEEADRVPQHREAFTVSMVMSSIVQVGVGVLQRVLPVLDRDHRTDVCRALSERRM